MTSRLLLLIFLLFSAVVANAQLKNSLNEHLFVSAEPQVREHIEISKRDFLAGLPGAQSSSVFDLPRNNPGAAFLTSAIIPGSAQALNGKWIRAGFYFTAEVVGIIYYLDRNAKAKRQERDYIRFTHQNWSVLAYSQWLVEYSQTYGFSNGWEQLENHISGKSPDFTNTVNDWGKVDLSLLHSIETKTPFLFNSPPGCAPSECMRASNFSHELPNYGSQQYYELISKYYQYQPGWKDYYNTAFNPSHPDYNPDHILAFMSNGQHTPSTLFYIGRDQAQQFNENYRTAGNILKLLLVNHVISAFDALFTVQLKNSRIETESNLLGYNQFSLTWHF